MKNINNLPWYIQMHGCNQQSASIKNNLGNVVGLFGDYRNAEACLASVTEDVAEIKSLTEERDKLEDEVKNLISALDESLAKNAS